MDASQHSWLSDAALIYGCADLLTFPLPSERKGGERNVFRYCICVCRSATEAFVIVKLVAARVCLLYLLGVSGGETQKKPQCPCGPVNIKTTSQLFLSAPFTEEG